jgi:hypothetical protein
MVTVVFNATPTKPPACLRASKTIERFNRASGQAAGSASIARRRAFRGGHDPSYWLKVVFWHEATSEIAPAERTCRADLWNWPVVSVVRDKPSGWFGV